ncbi:hypothetical protein M0R04_11005 [Candidatus Dojkabacteria bacterium]|nr:hypothetical protein [Candidatus Dojkabacteria bacterium]
MTDTQLFQRDIQIHNIEQALKALNAFKEASKHNKTDNYKLIESAIQILKEILE